MHKLDNIAYCGLYCKICKIPTKNLAQKLKTDLYKKDFLDWAPYRWEGFKEFWEILSDFSEQPLDNTCRSGQCGNPKCAILNCAKERKVELCPLCEEYPCEKIKIIAKSESTMLYDGLRLKEIGLDKWLKEQEERIKEGFSYSIVRCGKCTVPMIEDEE